MMATTRRTGAVRTGGRSARVVSAVLAAAVLELRNNGYDSFRVDSVAKSAGVNKTSVYRRWPNKLELVTAALRARPVMTAEPPNTGTLRNDLAEIADAWGRHWASIDFRDTATMLKSSNPAIVAALAAQSDEYYARYSTIVSRAIERGELPATTNPRVLLQGLVAHVKTATISAQKQLERRAVEQLIDRELHSALGR